MNMNMNYGVVFLLFLTYFHGSDGRRGGGFGGSRGGVRLGGKGGSRGGNSRSRYTLSGRPRTSIYSKSSYFGRKQTVNSNGFGFGE